jgi:hypothetical protein
MFPVIAMSVSDVDFSMSDAELSNLFLNARISGGPMSPIALVPPTAVGTVTEMQGVPQGTAAL